MDTTAEEVVDIKLDYSLNLELEKSIRSYSGTIKVGPEYKKTN
jgi:hypothetical protein